MPVAIDPTSRIEYILEAEQGKEDAAVFYLQAPTSSKKARIKGKFISLIRASRTDPTEDAGNGEDLPIEVAIEYALIVLEEVLVGWDNFFDSEGRKVPFKTVNKRANIDRLSMEDQEELGAEAQKLMGFGTEEAKNSDGLSTSPDSPTSSNAGTTATTGGTVPKKKKATSPSGK